MAKAILLAEDSPDDELFFKLVLKRNGIENPVVVVRDGGGAIAYLEGTGEYADRTKCPLPGILFLDLKMPGVDGFGVLEWLKGHRKAADKPLVIVLTQMGDAAQIQRAYDLGANSFLPKPFSNDDLENLVAHFRGYWLGLKE